jgi:hypothetical protein
MPGLYLTVLVLAGCGGASDVHQIPEASKKALIQRKIDVKAGVARSTSTSRKPSRQRGPTP